MSSSIGTQLLKGAAAGVVGTVAMDLLWYRRSQDDGGGETSFGEWELTEAESFEEAGPPAQVGQMAADAAGVELPEPAAGTTNDVVHWLTGIGYGAAVQGLMLDRRRNPAASALATGAGAWLNSYAVLGALGVYKPIWEYDAGTLKKDLSAHLVFGAATAVAYRALSAAPWADSR